MALPILHNWKSYFDLLHEGLGSSYERIILNRQLQKLVNQHAIHSVLEAPVFGFTGLTGLNSFYLTRLGCQVTLAEHDPERLDYIEQLFNTLPDTPEIFKVERYTTLPFKDGSFDLSWNFSAIWFVEHLQQFLAELDRITEKVILICVPNTEGLGYRWQKADTRIPAGLEFHPENIQPNQIVALLKRLGWSLEHRQYIDCPPWPDIGTSKEKLFARLLRKPAPPTPIPGDIINILDYYRGKDPYFEQRMLKYAVLETFAPDWFKRLWAHHIWLQFIRR